MAKDRTWPADSREAKLMSWHVVPSLDRAEKRLARFLVAFEADPASAFEWSQSDFEAAAIRRVLGQVQHALTDADSTATFDTIRDHAGDEVERGAKYPSFSTSASSNLMAQFQLAAWATLVDRMRGIDASAKAVS